MVKRENGQLEEIVLAATRPPWKLETQAASAPIPRAWAAAGVHTRVLDALLLCSQHFLLGLPSSLKRKLDVLFSLPSIHAQQPIPHHGAPQAAPGLPSFP